jgi:hypothetical protein
VERSLYQRAVGCSYEAVRIFMPAGHNKPVYAPYIDHVPPDVKNRDPQQWRDAQRCTSSSARWANTLALGSRRGHDDVMQTRSFRGPGEPARVIALNKCMKTMGTRSAQSIRASGHIGRTN